ncbi:MAG TPA: DUF4157 domain-containing protein [Pyrinomonadaceae bacterium]|nr:DUF4157 domain-containing protein [Pyrinomonadaceae bacterium]
MGERVQTNAPAQAQAATHAARPSITPVPTALLQRACACGQLPGSGGKCDDCDKKNKGKTLQRASNGAAGPTTIPPSVNQVLSSPGRPLDTPTRSFMESRFGHDFGSVRIHNDSAAAESARAVNAKAYTVGNDIVFDHGNYNPGTQTGDHLLAHELAHTVQQGGVHRYANDLRMGGAMEQHLEREADSAAHAALAPARGATFAPAPVASRATGPIISRTEAQPPPATPAGGEPAVEEPVRDWEEVPVADPLSKIATHQSKLRPGVISASIRGYKVKEPFPLPAGKGPVKTLWETRAGAQALESIIDTAGNPRSVLKQQRPDTTELRRIWLARVGWTKDDAAKNWKAAGGDDLTSFEPKAGKNTCEMDHVIELQIGGNNSTENILPLDRDENGASGREIFKYLKDKAESIRSLTNVPQIILHFDHVNQASATCNICCQIAQKADTMAKAAAEAKAGAGVQEAEPYEIKAGVSTTLQLPLGTGAKRKTNPKVALAASDNTKNKAASTLIPGMVLETLNLKAQGSDTVDAFIDTTNQKTRLPITIDKVKGKERSVSLIVSDTRELKLEEKAKHPKIAFTYPYLSKGTITSLQYDPAVGLSGAGTITPSIPILSKLNLGIEFSPNDLKVTAGIDPAKIKPPFPGLTITKAELALVLAPEFNPSGTLNFDLAPGGKKILDAQLKITRGASGGFLVTGDLHAYIPGVDDAKGQIKYEDGQWSGFAKAETTQIKLPYVTGGTVEAGFNEKGPYGQGTINLEIPGGHKANVSLIYKNQKWYFTGKGAFKIPRIDTDVTLVISYFDGEILKGSGSVSGFNFKGLTGSLTVYYEGKVGAPKPRIWGDGKLKFQKPKDKPKATGELTIHLLESGKFSGEGNITYEIKPGLVAAAGIKIDEQEKVTVIGSLTFPPYLLFKKFPDPAKRITIFEMPTISIPIPGASIGPIGLQAKIDAGIYADYGVGPGEIRGGYIKTSFNPLEPNVDLDVEVGGQVYIPAFFSVTGSVSGSVALDVKIASVAGGLTVSVTAALNGHVLSNLKARYFKGTFEAQADFELLLALALYLALKAFVKAEAGVWRFKVETTKEWKLAEFKFDTGLKLGLKLKKPVAYSSETGFSAPSLDDIEWILPTFDPQKAVKESFARDKGVENPPAPPAE